MAKLLNQIYVCLKNVSFPELSLVTGHENYLSLYLKDPVNSLEIWISASADFRQVSTQ